MNIADSCRRLNFLREPPPTHTSAPSDWSAHIHDPDDRLAAVTAELVDLERDLRTATAHVRTLANEPSIRTLPDGGLEGEHDRWETDRRARLQAAARETRERWARQQEQARRIEPPPPSRGTPDHGWGIGR